MPRAPSASKRAKPGSRGGGRVFHIELRPSDRFVGAEAKKMFASLGSAPVHVEGDRFRAKPRRDIPEDEKPTPAMRRAQLSNIKKAQAALRKRRKASTQ